MKTEAEFWSHTRITPGPLNTPCWLWNGAKTKGGYGEVKWYGVVSYCHRLALEFTEGSLDPTLEICHSCDQRSCCNPFHIWQGTAQQNITDMVQKDRQAKGIVHGMSKLTPKQVLEIRSLRGVMTQRDIAVQFGISHQQVADIQLKKRWAWLKDT